MDEGLSSRVENILRDILGDDIDLEKPRSRVEALLLALAEYISEIGGGYQGFSPWPYDPRRCARVVVIGTGDASCKCSLRRPITDTADSDPAYYPWDDYDSLPTSSSDHHYTYPQMRFFDSEFCTFNVIIDTDPESGDSYTVVSEPEFNPGINPTDTMVTLANTARGFFTEPDPTEWNFRGFLQKIFTMSPPTSLEHLDLGPVSYWVFA